MSETKAPKTVRVEPPKDVAVVQTQAVGESSEVEAQIAAAHRHPRDVRKFLEEAKALATLTEEIAESCLYRLKRWDAKLQMEVPLVGPSVRLAEICLSFWGNCHAGARPLEETPRSVRAQGVCWDVERNVRVTMETARGILTRNGVRYKDDLVNVTMAAAQAVAFRNAVFKIIPVALVDDILESAKAAAIGEVPTKRAKVIKRLGEWGASLDRVLASLGRKAIEEITVSDLEILIASGQTLKAGDQTVDELFPPLAKPAETAAQPGPAATVPRETSALANTNVTPISSVKPKQETLATVGARNRASRGAPPAARADVDDVIGGAPKPDPTYEEQEKANREAAAPKDDDMPPWSQP